MVSWLQEERVVEVNQRTVEKGGNMLPEVGEADIARETQRGLSVSKRKGSRGSREVTDKRCGPEKQVYSKETETVCVCVCVCVREREREKRNVSGETKRRTKRERERERQTDRQTDGVREESCV